MCHVLIIEDEPLIALWIRDVLEEEGATSFSFAATQQEAIVAAAAELPAFITSDVKLLEGTGPLAVEAIRRRHGALPVLFITASPTECGHCSTHTRIITKPFGGRLVARAFHELRNLCGTV